MDEGREELLGLAVRIKELRQKVARLPLVRELAELEAEFEHRFHAAVPVPAIQTAAPKNPKKKAAAPKARRAAAKRRSVREGSLRERLEWAFHKAPGRRLTWAEAGLMLGVDPKTLRSTISTFLATKKIKRVDRGAYEWGPEVGNGALSLRGGEERV